MTVADEVLAGLSTPISNLEDRHLERYIAAYKRRDLRPFRARDHRFYTACYCSLGFMLMEEHHSNSPSHAYNSKYGLPYDMQANLAVIECIFEGWDARSSILDELTRMQLIYDACKAELQRRSDLAIGKEIEALIEESSLVEVGAR